MSHDTTTERGAADAVVRHHAQLAGELNGHTTRLLDAAAGADERAVWQHRDELLSWLNTELMPHAQAEEAGLYPAAAAAPGGALLVDGMIGEHRAIANLVDELGGATSPVAAAAAARAIAALFEIHLAKENDLVLPLLIEADDVSLAELLHGMHELLGASH